MLDVRFFAVFVRFSPKSGRIDTVTVESARDPTRTLLCRPRLLYLKCWGKRIRDPTTRANLRSPWDTLHPGRNWAWRDPNMADARPPDRIIADLREHFASEPIYADLDQILREFVEELRQL